MTGRLLRALAPTLLCSASIFGLPAAARAADELPLLPVGARHDPAIPTPAQGFGFEPGAWHVRPDLIVRYAEQLAAASERVTLLRYGSTHEDRPLLLLAITSPRNQARLEDIRRRHVAGLLAGREPDADQPIVVWMGYSVHGNEPSGANASMLVAWHLAAGLDDDVTGLLDETVVLIDPAINPDGLGRFATWANMHKGRQLVADGNHREHREPWPSGRTNHYWFDLNRDWLLLTQPESRGRVAQFQRWRPTVLTDHHEMGTDSTFFFQPGVPSRTNPLTPPDNLELTRAIARFHAQALDDLGALYYSEEGFDDFYLGKGSSYPDALGSIGILFEQASSRGHLQENAWGELPFRLTIRNQVATSLSTLAAARSLRRELLTHQAATTRAAMAPDQAGPAGWVFGAPHDPARTAHMIDLLLRHGLEVRPLTADVVVDVVDGERAGGPSDPHGTDDSLDDGGNGHAADRPEHARRFAANASHWVPARQPNGLLARSLFATPTAFADDTFYDVSTWTLPLAMGVPFAALDAAPADLGAPHTSPPPTEAASSPGAPSPTAAYALRWGSLHAARALARLHAAGVRAAVATRPFGTTLAGRHEDFEPGTIVVPTGVQVLLRPELDALMATIAREDAVPVLRLPSALTGDGIDLGSPSMAPLHAPTVALLVGGGVSSNDAGEVWHHLDVRLGLPVVLLDAADLSGGALDAFTHLVLVDGRYGALSEQQGTLRDWVLGGGVLVATCGGAEWVGSALLDLTRDDEPEPEGDQDGGEPPAPAAYADYEGLRAKELVSGAILAARVDATHPLAFGLGSEPMALFRRGATAMAADDDPFAAPLVYLEHPLLSGYVSAENQTGLAGTAAATATRLGAGTLVRLADDPVFRGYFLGSARLLENALFFGDVVKSTRRLGGAPKGRDDDG